MTYKLTQKISRIFQVKGLFDLGLKEGQQFPQKNDPFVIKTALHRLQDRLQDIAVRLRALYRSTRNGGAVVFVNAPTVTDRAVTLYLTKI